MSDTPSSRPRHDAARLAHGYSPAIRLMEITSILAFALLEGWLAWRLWHAPALGAWAAVGAGLLGYLAADLVSGVVHWLGDTWGRTDFPVLGPAFIRPFREHHVDEKAITRHDFVETNGNNCLVSLPVAALALALPLGSAPGAFVAAFLGAMIFWVMATNQFHKWSHLDAPPRAVALLQRLGLVLQPAHHRVHHTPPFNRYYCITTGWMNAPLAWVGFFPLLERLVTRLTGLVPRQDDLGAAAAWAVMAEAARTPSPAQRAVAEVPALVDRMAHEVVPAAVDRVLGTEPTPVPVPVRGGT